MGEQGAVLHQDHHPVEDKGNGHHNKRYEDRGDLGGAENLLCLGLDVNTTSHGCFTSKSRIAGIIFLLYHEKGKLQARRGQGRPTLSGIDKKSRDGYTQQVICGWYQP